MNRSLLALLALTFTSCASLFEGTTSDITFVSEPPGAAVEVDGQSGVTPFSTGISKKTKEATFTSTTGEVQVVDLNRSMSGGYVVMDILFTPGFGLTGLLIDGVSGAWYKHPSVISANFTQAYPSVAEELDDLEVEEAGHGLN
ncbi:MAG: hypothetical protein P1V81_18700 [Planctomycetota bacterium]|nr:hypothetical protein [Planctomycetota bacterium]